MIRALALTGPTASGKTALSLLLAKELNAEILSCDSMQVYRGMDVGTAKATPEERQAVPHRLLDLVDPTEDYSVERYRKDAVREATATAEKGKLPLFVGGTGLYVDSLSRAPQESVPKRADERRAEHFPETPEEKHALWEKLQKIDPESAAAIHENNVRRVLRAIEIYEETGVPKSELDRRSKETATELSVAMITLDFHDRENLYRRTDRRVDEMLAGGLEAEVRALVEEGKLLPGSTAAQAIGYKEMLAYLAGDGTLDEACEAIRLATRHYAKRQLTWFRREENAYRLYLDREDGTLRPMKEIADEALAAAKALLSAD